jgi:predicted ribosome quality control (RQC) complex YloA/Tae2 family protein
MSNFDIAVLLNEIVQSVIGAWINNIYQIKEAFLFKLNTKSGEKTLLVKPGCGIYLTKYQIVAPKAPTNFCSSLRKHIRDRRIEAISQHDLDRIVKMVINGEHGKYSLIVELFGEGNLILCDQENRIVLARRYKVMRDRSIKPKDVYAPPPLRGIDLTNLSLEEVSSILGSSTAGLVETLASRLNIDPLYAEEICLVSNLKTNVKSKDLNKDEISRLFETIQLTVSRLKTGPYRPQIVYDASGRPISTTPFDLRVFENSTSKRMENFNDAIDEFFSVVGAGTAKGLEEKGLEAKTKEIERAIEEQRKKISESEKTEINNRRFGDLIYSNLPQVEEILSTILKARRKGVTWQEIERKFEEVKRLGVASTDKVSSFAPGEGTVTLRLDGEEIPVDVRLSASENASKFYEHAKKAEVKKKGAESALKEALEKLKKLQGEGLSIREKTLKVKRVKKWYESYRWFISSDGFLAIGGRDANTNTIIVKKKMEPNDIFVHADVHGAPVVVIKSEGKEVPKTTLMEACQFSASYSSLWKLGTGAGDAYYVRGEQVSFSPPSGEYLQKGSFIVRGERTYAKGVPLRISVGIILDEDGNVIPVAGPPSSIASRTKISVELVPGEGVKSKSAHSIRDRLARIAGSELEQKIEEIELDEFLRLLPSGGVRIE